jgi:hypothetical protein
LEEIGRRFGFTPRRRWLLKGLRAAVSAFWTAGIEDIFIDGSFCTEKSDPEETEYQTVAIARLQEILDAIGIKALVTLSA